MIFEKLLQNRIIEPCEVSFQEIAGHLRVARHDINLAQTVKDLDLDWGFTIAYNGILQTALTYMYFKGFRPRGEGKHINTIKFLAIALPEEFHNEIGRLQKLRKKRNQAVYQSRGVVTEKEAKDIIAFSAKFLDEISSLLPDDIIKMSKES